MKLLREIKNLFTPAPSKKVRRAESMKAIEMQRSLRHETHRLKQATQALPRHPFDSIVEG